MIEKGSIIYYIRPNLSLGKYVVCPLKVRAVYEKSVIGVFELTKQSYLVGLNNIGNMAFTDKEEAEDRAKYLTKNNKIQKSSEKDCDEYE